MWAHPTHKETPLDQGLPFNPTQVRCWEASKTSTLVVLDVSDQDFTTIAFLTGMLHMYEQEATVLGAKGIATRSKDATRGSLPYY